MRHDCTCRPVGALSGGSPVSRTSFDVDRIVGSRGSSCERNRFSVGVLLLVVGRQYVIEAHVQAVRI